VLDIVVIGASGHGREVAEILEAGWRQGLPGRPVGFVDDDIKKHGQRLDGLPVLGGFEWLENQAHPSFNVICAVGEPRTLESLAKRARSLGLSFANVVSPLARISPRASIGKGTMIFPNAVVNTGAVIGDHVILNVGATISHDSQVGSFSNINPGAHIAGNVSVGKGCYIGMGANLIQNVSIGAWSIIGAGAVVISDIPRLATAVGCPARVIKVDAEPE
jgi:sugar O-acyltransferase (sialic acid O-acetyltransferase NeuD family)